MRLSGGRMVAAVEIGPLDALEVEGAETVRGAGRPTTARLGCDRTAETRVEGREVDVVGLLELTRILGTGGIK